MIKLITQFDNEKSELSLATPTCGCCSCCCCCCIVSTFAAASVSARNFGKYVSKKLPDEPKKIKYARRFGFWYPLGLLASLGLGLLIADETGSNGVLELIIIGVLYLAIIISSITQKLNITGLASRVIGYTILLGIFEVIGFYLGIFALVYLGWWYLACAIIISIFLICWAFGKQYDKLETKEKDIEIDDEK